MYREAWKATVHGVVKSQTARQDLLPSFRTFSHENLPTRQVGKVITLNLEMRKLRL